LQRSEPLFSLLRSDVDEVLKEEEKSEAAVETPK
jgi:hypothetical protein